MTDKSMEVEVAVLREKTLAQERELISIKADIKAIREEYQRKERNMLIGFITVVGSGMVALVTVIWNNRGAFF